MTEQELAGIEARANAATAGPWQIYTDADSVLGLPLPEGVSAYPLAEFMQADSCVSLYAADYAKRDHRTYSNAEFIAHARTDVPALLAEVRRLRGLVEAAYHEGFYDGEIAATFPHKVREWQYSDARRALDGAP